MTPKYFNLKEQYSILSNIAKHINMLNEIKYTYGVGNMTVDELDKFLSERYAKIEQDIEQEIKS